MWLSLKKQHPVFGHGETKIMRGNAASEMEPELLRQGRNNSGMKKLAISPFWAIPLLQNSMYLVRHFPASGVNFMLAISFVYGLTSGIIVITAIIMSFTLGDSQHFFSAAWLGYLVMIVALSLIFFGTKRYRDREFGGTIKFWHALAMGMAIAVVASITYVLIWEVYLAATGYSFISDYASSLLEQKTSEGLSETALAAEAAALAELVTQYANPLFRLPITFLEICPVGLIIALISSALLRNPKFAPARA